MSLSNRDAEQVTAGPCSTPAATAEGGRAKEMCHSTKRTHFISAYFSVYQFYLKALTRFAAAFANGFVLEKRTHLEGISEGLRVASSGNWQEAGITTKARRARR